jgi:hypothetical protein
MHTYCAIREPEVAAGYNLSYELADEPAEPERYVRPLHYVKETML